MRIERFHHAQGHVRAYAYLICRWWEIPLIKQRAKGNKRIRYAPKAYGPEAYGAQFIVQSRPKSKK